MNIVTTMLAAYLAGGFPTGVIAGRLLHHRDIREFGSRNPGAINVWRTFGLGCGMIVVMVDIGKGFFATYLLPRLSGGESMRFTLILGLIAVGGHIWSPWLRLRGGKGVATAFGAVAALYPLGVLVSVGVWVVSLALTRYASVASLTAAFFTPAAVHWIYHPAPAEMILIIALPFLLTYTHRGNLQRLWSGEELKVGGNR